MDLRAIKRKIEDGINERELSSVHFELWVRNHRAFKKYKVLHTPKRNWEMSITVLVGPTGVGKTRWVYDNFEDLYSVPPTKQSGCYWDGYDGQEVVLIDEMYGSRFSYAWLLQLLDRYSFLIPVHGGQVPFTSSRIIMCSNSHPDEWYDPQKFPFSGSPLERRLTQGRSSICGVQEDGTIILYEGEVLPTFIGPLME